MHTCTMLCSMAEYKARTLTGASMRCLPPSLVVAVMTAVDFPAFMTARATCDLHNYPHVAWDIFLTSPQ